MDPAKLNALMELERRGALSPERTAVLAELRRRGAIPQAAGGAAPAAPPRPRSRWTQTMEDFSTAVDAFHRGAISGGTMRVADYISALGGALRDTPRGWVGLGEPGTFGEHFERNRQQFREPIAASPVAGTIGELAGGVAGGAASGLGALRAVPWLARLGPWKQAATIGAGEGAITGALGGPVRDAPTGALGGAALGAGAGLGMSAVGAGLRYGAQRGYETLYPQGMPQRYVQHALQSADMTPEHIAELLPPGQGPEVIGDLAPELQAMLLRGLREPGATAQAVKDALLGRTRAQGARLNAFARSHVSGMSADDVARELTARQDVVGALYADVYENIPLTNELRELLTKPGARPFYKPALDTLANKAANPTEVTLSAEEQKTARDLAQWLFNTKGKKEPPTKEINTHLLHVLSQKLGERARNLTQATVGVERSGTQARGLSLVDKALREYLKKASPKFARVQAREAPILRGRAAFELGQTALTRPGTAQELAKELDNIARGETSVKRYFKAGVRDALRRHGASTPDFEDTWKPFTTRDMRNRLGLVLDTPADKRAFNEAVRREERMFRTDRLATDALAPSGAEEDLSNQRAMEFALTRLAVKPTFLAQYAAGQAAFRNLKTQQNREMWNAIAGILGGRNLSHLGSGTPPLQDFLRLPHVWGGAGHGITAAAQGEAQQANPSYLQP